MHGPGDVERQHDALPRCLDSAEGQVERTIQRVDHCRERLPHQRSATATPTGIGGQRRKHGNRVDACSTQCLGIAQPRHNGVDRRVTGDKRAIGGQASQVAQQRRQRQLGQEGTPHGRFAQPLARHRFPRQFVALDEFHDLANRSCTLGTLEGPDLAHRFHRVRLGAHVVPAPGHPVQDDAVLGGRRLGMRQAQRIAVRPAIARLVLDRLVGQRFGRLVGIPRPDRLAKTAAPATEGLDVGQEVEEMRPRARNTRQRSKGGAAGCLVAKRRGHGQRKERRVVLGRTALLADGDDALDRSHAIGL